MNELIKFESAERLAVVVLTEEKCRVVVCIGVGSDEEIINDLEERIAADEEAGDDGILFGMGYMAIVPLDDLVAETNSTYRMELLFQEKENEE